MEAEGNIANRLRCRGYDVNGAAGFLDASIRGADFGCIARPLHRFAIIGV